jgi:hypothetical protein
MSAINYLDCFNLVQKFDTTAHDLKLTKTQTVAINEVGGWIQTSGDSVLNLDQENTAETVVHVTANVNDLTKITDANTLLVVCDMLGITNEKYFNNTVSKWHDLQFVNNWLKSNGLIGLNDSVSTAAEIVPLLEEYYETKLPQLTQKAPIVQKNLQVCAKVFQSNTFKYNVARITDNSTVDVSMNNVSLTKITAVLDEYLQENLTLALDNKYIKNFKITWENNKLKEYSYDLTTAKCIVETRNTDDVILIYNNYPKLQFTYFEAATGKQFTEKTYNKHTPITPFNTYFMGATEYIIDGVAVKHNGRLVFEQPTTPDEYTLEDDETVQFIRLPNGSTYAFIHENDSVRVVSGRLKLPSTLDTTARKQQYITLGVTITQEDGSDYESESQSTTTQTTAQTTTQTTNVSLWESITTVVIIVALFVGGYLLASHLRQSKEADDDADTNEPYEAINVY